MRLFYFGDPTQLAQEIRANYHSIQLTVPSGNLSVVVVEDMLGVALHHGNPNFLAVGPMCFQITKDHVTALQNCGVQVNPQTTFAQLYTLLPPDLQEHWILNPLFDL